MADCGRPSIAELVAVVRKGSVVAAAGCGKTEQIALATKIASGRRLLLTNTHAGIDVLRQRLNRHSIPSTQYHLDTIAGWCLRYAAAFPLRSGLTTQEPKTNADWQSIYRAATKLIASGAVDRVLAASYSGVFVDEYQDCGDDQHAVITSLAEHLPICVFGDHLQAIFDFKGHAPVDWKTEVSPIFPEVARLTKPWRWHKAGNPCLADWLERVRISLDAGQELDFRVTPQAVEWEWLPDQDGPRNGKIVAACQAAMKLNGRVVVIADPVNLEGRAKIAKALAKQGFSNIEPVDCKSLFASAKTLDTATDESRLTAAMDFLTKCMTGVSRSAFLAAVASRKAGGRRGMTQFGHLIEVGLEVEQKSGERHLLNFLESFERDPSTNIFRREMFSAMRSGLKAYLAGESVTLTDALWHVQNRVRHAGRVIARRSIGSTLLVKGLEFEHAIVVHAPCMNLKDWYVALTRATHSLKVLSPQKRFLPPK